MARPYPVRDLLRVHEPGIEPRISVSTYVGQTPSPKWYIAATKKIIARPLKLKHKLLWFPWRVVEKTRQVRVALAYEEFRSIFDL